MNIGIAREIAAKGKELRTMLMPREVKRLVEERHDVVVERGLGRGVYAEDSEYRDVGATITKDRKKIFRQDIVVKLKPPLPNEFRLMKNNILFSMLHAEQNPQYISMLKKVGAKAIAMELIRNRAGERLIQCTDIAGEQGMIMAFHMVCKSPRECKVVVLGYGAVASGALNIADSLGAQVKILRKSEFRYIRHFVRNADIVVNALSWPKEKRDAKEYIITRNMLKLMSKGGVILDLSVDFPNPIESCHPTLIDAPVYSIEGIRHISIFGYPVLASISSAKRYSRQVVPITLKIAQARKIERLPAYLKRAVIDPETYEF